MKAKKKELWAAINAKCKECIYDPAPGNGTWRQQVEACTSTECPLYHIRAKTTTKRVAFHAQGDEKTIELGWQI